jgi:hypothetical protein
MQAKRSTPKGPKAHLTKWTLVSSGTSSVMMRFSTASLMTASAVASHMAYEKVGLARISEGASQSWCSPAGESPARVRPSEPPGSKCCVSRR